MEKHDLHVSFLDLFINKGPETNKVWMIFHKKADTRRCVPSNDAIQNTAKRIFLLLLLDGFALWPKILT